VKIWREKDSPFCKCKELREEDRAQFVEKCELENFATNSQYMQWLRSQNGFATTSVTPVMSENRGSGNKRMKDWPSKILRIHMTNFVDDLHHLCMLVLS
jgi:hypothetical protein